MAPGKAMVVGEITGTPGGSSSVLEAVTVAEISMPARRG